MPNYKEHKLYNEEVTILFNEEGHQYWIQEDKKRRLAGATTFLGIVDKSTFLLPWAVGITIDFIKNNLDRISDDPKLLLEEAKRQAELKKQEAADLGTEIHSWIEKHIKGEKPEIPDNENVKRGVISFLEWEAQYPSIEYLDSEKVVYSRTHDYVGTLDIIARIEGKLYLIDIKTGNNVYAEAKAQTAAYVYADNEERGTEYEGRIILRISKETEPDYLNRMKDKAYFKKEPEKYPYKVFEAIYLDQEENNIGRDFEAFLSCLNLYRWKQIADKE